MMNLRNAEKISRKGQGDKKTGENGNWEISVCFYLLRHNGSWEKERRGPKAELSQEFFFFFSSFFSLATTWPSPIVERCFWDLGPKPSVSHELLSHVKKKSVRIWPWPLNLVSSSCLWNIILSPCPYSDLRWCIVVYKSWLWCS